jgi:hypothetical protein
LLDEKYAFFAHEPDHIIPEKHGGSTTLDNLALACFDCNRFKGPNIASLDPINNELVPLFNPRIQEWNDHFKTEGGTIAPLTAVGRVTEQILRLNLPKRVEVRNLLSENNLYP